MDRMCSFLGARLGGWCPGGVFDPPLEGMPPPSGFFLSSIHLTPIFEKQLSHALHNTLILDPCRNGRNLRVREVRSSILRLALFVRPNGLVVLCFFLFFLP